MSIWVTALIMGLAGSLHCAGMCSPLVLAATANRPFIFSKVIYNLGRILVYALIGSLAAALGTTVLNASYQNYFSILLGILMLLIGMGVISGIQIPLVSKLINWIIAKLKSAFGHWLHSKSGWATFILGMLNGLLPCGLTYIAVAYCLVLPSAMDGFFFMLLFGIGTWPVMVGMTWILGFLTKNIKVNFKHATAGVFFLTGMLLIFRVFVTVQGTHTQELNVTGKKSVTLCK